MAKKYTPSDMDKVIVDELDSFYNACVEDIQEAAQAAAKYAQKRLKNESPKRFGNYAADWKINHKKNRSGSETTVYNDKLYMLSHLLEYGHPTGNGGRTEGKQFIKPIEDAANDKFVQEIERRAGGGT